VRSSQTNNDEVIAGAAQLYIKPGSIVADVTWGKGAFWRKTRTSSFTLLGSDIDPGFGGAAAGADFRNLPYAAESIDVVVLDPPYIAWPGKHITDHRYNNAKTTGWESDAPLSYDGILRLYQQGMHEAVRVLKTGGFLWVKCKDQVNGGKQHWAQRDLANFGEMALGLYQRDMFIVTPRSVSPDGRWQVQKHARKNHSFLLIFEKTKAPGRSGTCAMAGACQWLSEC
jgi:DNA modification methylase